MAPTCRALAFYSVLYNEVNSPQSNSRISIMRETAFLGMTCQVYPDVWGLGFQIQVSLVLDSFLMGEFEPLDTKQS